MFAEALFVHLLNVYRNPFHALDECSPKRNPFYASMFYDSWIPVHTLVECSPKPVLCLSWMFARRVNKRPIFVFMSRKISSSQFGHQHLELNVCNSKGNVWTFLSTEPNYLSHFIYHNLVIIYSVKLFYWKYKATLAK